MTHIKFGLITVFVLAVAIGLFSACSSGDDADQPQAQPDRETTIAATSVQDDEQSQSRESTGVDSSQQQRDSTEQASEDAGTQSRVAAAEQSEQEESVQTQSRDVQDDEQEGDDPAQSVAAKPKDDEEQDSKADADEDDGETKPEPAQSDDSEADAGPTQESQSEESEPVNSDPDDEAQSDTSAGQQQQEEQEQAEPAPREPSGSERLQLRAEEIRADATVTDLVGLNGWLNGAETTIALELAKGNVVLIDFWTYTCINCVRTLPFLTEWDRKYRDHGLVIIGVHTPEFEFEERIENVRTAIAEHGIEYLVAIDNDYRTWRAFQNRWWPRKFLIGPTDDGSPMGVRYDHIGEGHYPETEREIRAALEAVGKDISDIPFGVEASIPTRQGGTPRQTRELYAGWRRNVGSGGPYAGQDSYFLAGTGIDTLYRDVDYSDREHNLWYLEGLWRTEDESIVHARETDDLEDYIALLMRGRTANVVLTVAENGRPFNVYVELDGRWVFPNEAGSHVQWDDEGRSYIRVTENDLYRLLFLPEWSEHELKLRSDSDQFRIFAFTFGSYVGGE